MKSGGIEEPQTTLAEVALEHVDTICQSSAFGSSKRCQEFLRYIVIETLRGHTDQIKERTIARVVFGKGEDFEPGEFSLVRVKAGELRKRLSNYYEATPPQTVRIELPLGSYIPRIVPTSEALSAAKPKADGKTLVTKRFNRRRFVWTAGGCIGVLGAGSLLPLLRSKSSPLDRLWQPIFATKLPLLISIPIMSYINRDLTQFVGIGPAASLGIAADFLTKHHHPYHVRFGSELTFSQLREQPSLLLGGFGLDWTVRMTRSLRFDQLEDSANTEERTFIDKTTNQVWKAKRPGNQDVDVDFGMLCRLFDSTTGQIALLALGTWTYGTLGAANFLFHPELFADLVRNMPSNWETKNIQAVIRVSVIGSALSTPQLIATHSW